MGYYCGWFWDVMSSNDPSVAVSQIDFTTMTHWAFGRYAPGQTGVEGSSGDILEAAGTAHANVEQLMIDAAHEVGTKAIMMIGGVGDGNRFAASTSDSSMTQTFVDNILDKCVEMDYDGADIDWEDSIDGYRLIELISKLKESAKTRPRYQTPNDPFLITFPTGVLNMNYMTPDWWQLNVSVLVDQFNLMSYGHAYNYAGWFSWFFMALKGHAGNYPTSIDSTIQSYVDFGIERMKIGIGIGFYGVYYSLPITQPRQDLQGGGWIGGVSDYIDKWSHFYEQGLFDQGTYVFDNDAGTGYYTYSPEYQYERTEGNFRSISYLSTEDIQSIEAKCNYVKEGNANGVIVWAIDYGYVDSLQTNPPMNEIKRVLLTGNSIRSSFCTFIFSLSALLLLFYID